MSEQVRHNALAGDARLFSKLPLVDGGRESGMGGRLHPEAQGVGGNEPSVCSFSCGTRGSPGSGEAVLMKEED